MREEILNWFKQAESDLKKAIVLNDNGCFDGVVFYSHQAVEKSLKSLYMLKFREIDKSHSIINLAKKLDVPKSMLSGIRDLNPEYLVSRYPDVANGIPAEMYDDEIAGRHLKTAKVVVEWVKSMMEE
ncbi:MAG: HEPN domain-containing protein [Promethearchaeota archaeon]